jgi:hypothetical protein
MIVILREIYDKKSPVFIITIIIFISTLIILFEPHNFIQCNFYQKLRTFEMTVAVILGIEIIFKTIGLGIVHFFSQ